ncbi:autotransporter domain-containing protein [Bradyrhizobium sp. S69]|uniref:autotransporter domain-containing protein n=1 Tax=Bradyrhizobium sp. S69 TaxID=1641856 RepID=UPI001FEE6EEE|nr:autotransporter domain-containing protein [Bradyrhizobium sp. S69]
MGFQSRLAEQGYGRLRRSVAAFLLCAAAMLAGLLPPYPACAQSYTWVGASTDYNAAANWSNPPAGAPPVGFGQSAIFSNSGLASVNVTAGPILPDSWTFNANAQSYLIGGADLQFGLAGASSGIFNNANTGVTISISNDIIEVVAGAAQVQQLGNSTLVLSGINSDYSGGTLISAGTVRAINTNSVGSGAVTLNGGTFQAPGLIINNDFNINTPGGTVDDQGTVLALAGNISNGNGGTGVLQLIDSTNTFGSEVVLSGTNNTYTGGTYVLNTTVQVNNNSSVGTGTVTLDNAEFLAEGSLNLTFTNNFKINNSINGSAIDAFGTTLTIAGNISDGNGPGKLTVLDSIGGGALVLLGNNTYTGGTFICSCGTLQLGDATHTASIVGAVDNEGVLNIVNANTSGIISILNDGGLTKFRNTTSASQIQITNQFGGETDFFGHSTAANATIMNTLGGLTTFGNFATAGNASITNDSSGETDFKGNSTAANATISNTNGGNTTFLNASTAGNANISNQSATTVFGRFGGNDTSTAGQATITNDNGVTIFLAKTNAGTATITNINGGGVIFEAHASAASATITNSSGSETVFNAFTTAANATIITNNDGATFFFDNSTGGTAQFITNGTGIVDFSGSSGPNGDGRITAGSIAGSGTYDIGVGNTLVVGGNNLSTTVSGIIADSCGCSPGSGSLEKVGAGTLILSGANTYTGTTAVNGGVLQVDGSIASSSQVTVNAGGTLAGAGTVSNTTIASGGIFAPGDATPGGFINVAGNLAFQSGALYFVQLNSTTSSFANVTGTAALNGQVAASFAPGSFVMKQYMILSAAGGVSGGFAGVATAPGGLVGSLSYDPTHAYLNFALNFAAKYALNVNQQNVATTLGNFFNANGGIPLSFASLTPAGLTQASGELATGSQQATFDAMSQFLALLTDPFTAGRNSAGGGAGATPFAEEGDASAYAASKSSTARDAFAKIPTKADVARNDLFDTRWNVWGAAYGGGSDTSGNAALGSNSANARAFGFVAGADYQISPSTLAGFALAGGGTSFGVSSFGSGRSDLFQAGAFVRHTVGPAYITAAAAYGWQDVTTNRTVSIAGIDQLRAEFNANAYSGRLEGGYRFATPWMGVTPYAAGQFTTYSLPAYAEQAISGANTFALNYAAKDVTASRSELGVRTDRSFAVPNGILTLRGRFAWAHDFDTDRDVTALFQTLPGTSFVVNGAAQAHDSALTTASAEMKWRNGISLAGTFEGQFSDVTNSYAGKGVVRYSW